MKTKHSRIIVAGVTALASIAAITECASAAQWRGGGGGWRGGHQFGPHFGDRYGFGGRRFWRRGALGFHSGPRGGSGSWGGQFRASRFAGVASGWRGGYLSRQWHAGFWNGGVWNTAWWGPASTLAVVDTYPSDINSDSSCWQVQPVYSAYGDYIGRQVINVCQ